ncbi:hypothetical protein Syun_005531 [Stephania yunnanensis]|uniref:Uncharacterized protein n=1 Tax=Stephania yunnanensis TaxID=152371 RepID=A0AAP0L8L6_9MAGN
MDVFVYVCKKKGKRLFMWVCQRVSYRGYWHSVHLQRSSSSSSSSSIISLIKLINGGGHPVNNTLWVSLCKTSMIYVITTQRPTLFFSSRSFSLANTLLHVRYWYYSR